MVTIVQYDTVQRKQRFFHVFHVVEVDNEETVRVKRQNKRYSSSKQQLGRNES